MVAALITASTCGNSRMTFMTASTVVGHFHHEADIQRRGHRHEDDEHDPVASLHIWVRTWHFTIIGRRPGPEDCARERRGLNASAQNDLGEHRCEQDEEVEN